MDDLLSEKEQIEQIRSWWSEYGGYVIGGLGLGVAILVGFNYWQNSKLEAQLGGSALYETLADHVASGNLEEAQVAAERLTADYAGTSYASQGRLAMARLYMDKNRDQDAADVLRALLAAESDEAVKNVARTRLARVLLYQGKPQEVVDLLEGQSSGAFAPTFNELLGDAYQELGRIEDAQAAYQAVLLDPMAQSTVNVQIVQWKALDLPDVAAADESLAPVEIVTEDVAPAEEDAPSDDSEAGDGE